MQDRDDKLAGYFAASAPWAAEIAALRGILQATELVETFKWRGPVYTLAGGNVATIWRLKDACGLSFFKGVLLSNPDNLLVAAGENSRVIRLFKFRDLAQITRQDAQIRATLAEAIALERAGAKVVLDKDDLPLPEELAARCDADLQFAQAFAALTPGRRRGYVLHISQAKQAATREARIDKHFHRILDGKGLHDR
ncbi:hypothetical protein AQS8620_02079 [Aquimixticola soesokkakensis]|uniref:YdhG-like domain-containing protein n=1 Tax=Aquimixticola soesokkakensis TaxID=1519096 RepID=A0A1Y5T063_9RHOB|nr:YdeI/OmpD-associated family protein [Aquimixticola soesokkakensis]SLN49056.1 hypothetical protein AQS8620_02079 [Aquimixticola soesokkakensis]